MRVIYKHENSILDTNDRRAKFYVNGRLRFMGDHYIAIKFFIQHSKEHPDVLKMFEKQLEQREKPKFVQSEREKKQKNIEIVLWKNQNQNPQLVQDAVTQKSLYTDAKITSHLFHNCNN